MCTVTFAPHSEGYYLAMNRDERRNRPKGLPPYRYTHPGNILCLMPAEPTGGTWLATHQSGITFCLLNAYSLPNPPALSHPISRGTIIPHFLPHPQPSQILDDWSRIPLPQMKPFRLMAFDLNAKSIIEFLWDGTFLEQKTHPWQIGQWSSSGFQEAQAQKTRFQTFQFAQLGAQTIGLDWLKTLHFSHHPESGPFSICMHREDAQTVSSTLISVHPRRITAWHHQGPPCDAGPWTKRYIQRKQFPDQSD